MCTNLLLLLLLATILVAQQQVGVGVHVVNLGEENLSEGSFYADFYLFLLTNPTPNASAQATCTGIPTTFANNSLYKPIFVNTKSSATLFNQTYTFRVQSKFYFDLKSRQYPYDTQVYDIVMELQDLPQVTFCFMPDYTNLSESIRFAGRIVKDFVYSYAITTRNVTYLNQTISRFSFQVAATRPFLKSFVKTQLPAIFICLVVLATYMLPASESVSRISVCGSMLVAAVMFHVGIESGLPLSSTLNRADTFMICVYIVVLLAFLLAMLLLRLRKNAMGNKYSDILAEYFEVPGMFGTPFIFFAILFEQDLVWVAVFIMIPVIALLLLLVYLYRRYVKEKVTTIFGKAVQDKKKVEQVENLDDQKEWVQHVGAALPNAEADKQWAPVVEQFDDKTTSSTVTVTPKSPVELKVTPVITQETANPTQHDSSDSEND